MTLFTFFPDRLRVMLSAILVLSVFEQNNATIFGAHTPDNFSSPIHSNPHSARSLKMTNTDEYQINASTSSVAHSKNIEVPPRVYRAWWEKDDKRQKNKNPQKADKKKKKTDAPTAFPTRSPSTSPTMTPSVTGSKNPTTSPTTAPSGIPTTTTSPSAVPTLTASPSEIPTISPSPSPSSSWSPSPTPITFEEQNLLPNEDKWSISVTSSSTLSTSPTITASPTSISSHAPTSSPTITASPTSIPSHSPTSSPTISSSPTTTPSQSPSFSPSPSSTLSPSPSSTFSPTFSPSPSSTFSPSPSATFSPSPSSSTLLPSTESPTTAATSTATPTGSWLSTGVPPSISLGYISVGFSVAMPREDPDLPDSRKRVNAVQNAVRNILKRDLNYRVFDSHDENLGGRALVEDNVEDVEDYVYGDIELSEGKRKSDDRLIFVFDEDASREIPEVVSSYHTTWYTYVLKYNLRVSDSHVLAELGIGSDHSKSAFMVNEVHQAVVNTEREVLVMINKRMEEGRLLELLQLSSPDMLGTSEIGGELEMAIEVEKRLQDEKNLRGAFQEYDTSGVDPIRIVGIVMFIASIIGVFVLICVAKKRQEEKKQLAVWGAVLASEEGLDTVLKSGKVEVMTDRCMSSDAGGPHKKSSRTSECSEMNSSALLSGQESRFVNES